MRMATSSATKNRLSSAKGSAMPVPCIPQTTYSTQESHRLPEKQQGRIQFKIMTIEYIQYGRCRSSAGWEGLSTPMPMSWPFELSPLRLRTTGDGFGTKLGARHSFSGLGSPKQRQRTTRPFPLVIRLIRRREDHSWGPRL